MENQRWAIENESHRNPNQCSINACLRLEAFAQDSLPAGFCGAKLHLVSQTLKIKAYLIVPGEVIRTASRSMSTFAPPEERSTQGAQNDVRAKREGAPPEERTAQGAENDVRAKREDAPPEERSAQEAQNNVRAKREGARSEERNRFLLRRFL